MYEIFRAEKKFYSTVLHQDPMPGKLMRFLTAGQLDEQVVEALLSHVEAIWPVSHSLCFAYLINGIKAVEHFPVELLAEWVRQILGLYEIKDLLGARQFMADVDGLFLGPMRGQAGVAFEEISSKMSIICEEYQDNPLISVLPNCHPLTPKQSSYQNFSTFFPVRQNNIFLYKFLVSLQWAHVESRIFTEVLGSDNEVLENIFTLSRQAIVDRTFCSTSVYQGISNLEIEFPG